AASATCRWRRDPAEADRRRGARRRTRADRRAPENGGQPAPSGTFYGKRSVGPSRIVFDLGTAREGFDDFIFYALERLPDDGEELKTRSFARSPGGGAVITAVAAARLGLRVAVVSALSDDAVRTLRAEGVSVQNLRQPGEHAAITVAL